MNTQTKNTTAISLPFCVCAVDAAVIFLCVFKWPEKTQQKKKKMNLKLSADRVQLYFSTLRVHASPEELDDVKTSVLVVGNLAEAPENQRSVAIPQFLFNAATSTENLVVILDHVAQAVTVYSPYEAAQLNAGDVATSSVVQLPADGSEEVFRKAVEQAKAKGGRIGFVKREYGLQVGPFATSFVTVFNGLVPDAERKDIGPLLACGTFVKDSASLASITKASSLSAAVMKRFVAPQLESALGSGEMPTLDTFENMIRYQLENPKELKGMQAVDFTNFGICMQPRVMHLGTYVPTLQSLDRNTQVMVPNVVCVRFGARQSGESSCVSRTFLMDAAPKEAIDAYRFLLDIHREVQAQLVIGTKLSDVYRRVIEYANSKNATLAKFLTNSFGFVTGLLLMEPRGTINEKCVLAVAADMPFVVRTVLHNITLEESSAPFSLEVCDTVIVQSDNNVEILTRVGRDVEDIVMKEVEVNDNEEEEQRPVRDLRAITRSGKSAVPLISREEERENKRRVLYARLHAEFLSNGGSKNREVEDPDVTRAQTIGQVALGELIPYRGSSQIPDLGATKLFVHREKRVAWLPVCGVPTPFHVSTIARVELKKDGNLSVLTVIFHSTQEANLAFRLNRTKIFIRDLTFSAPREDVFHEFVRGVNESIRDVKAADTESQNNQGLARTGGLRQTPNPKKLPNIKIRPAPIAGKHGVTGNVEIHENGLRFSSISCAPIEILYSNVKFFIYAPAIKSISTIFHVTLKQPILVGKKKTDQISFYADVLEASESVEGTRRSYEEELAMEERERQRVETTNKEFAIFSREVGLKAGRPVESPIMSFQLEGVTYRELTPISASNRVLWAVNCTPPFTMGVNEMELMAIERLTDRGINFDVTFVPKNYKQTVAITTVPRSCLDTLKDWALQAGLYYVESNVNLMWPALLKRIRDDPEWEPYGPGGWVAMTDDAEDDEEDEDMDDDSDPSYDSEESEEDEEDNDSDSEFSFETDSSMSTDSDSSGSDASWDALERKAAKHDRENDYSDESGDERPKKKAARSTAPTTKAPTKAPAGKVPGKMPTAPPSKMPGKFAVPVKGPVPAANFSRPGLYPPPRPRF